MWICSSRSRQRKSPRLLEALGEQFPADDQAFYRAIRDRSSVNVIHLPTATKIDLFVMGGSAIDDQQMSRRRKIQVGQGLTGLLDRAFQDAGRVTPPEHRT